VFQAGSDVQQLKGRDASRASQLQAQLDDLRDEVIYLKVKLRKEGSLQRSEYAGVRDRLDDLRSQATSYTTNYTPSTATNTATATSGTNTNRSTGSCSGRRVFVLEPSSTCDVELQRRQPHVHRAAGTSTLRRRV